MKSVDKTIVQPLEVFMIGTYDENGNPDVMNAAWGGQCGLKHITFNLAPIRKTLKNIEINKEFTVAFATKEVLEVADYFGLVSASKVEDKVEKAGVTISPAEKVNAPVVEEFPITLECKVLDIQEIVPGRITVTGEIVNTLVQEKYVDENGNVDTESIEFISYDGNARVYRVLGETVGKAFDVNNIFK